MAPEIIRSALGEPNRKLSTKRQWRWGRKGSFALNVTGPNAGLWFDHENGVGGDIIDFIKAENCCSIGQAIQIGLELIGGGRAMTAPHHEGAAEPEDDDAVRTAGALAIWNDGIPLRGSLAEQYLKRRGIEVHADTLEVLRFHPSCPIGRRRAPACLALVQDIVTGEPIGIHRRELTPDAGSAGPAMSLGPKSGGVIRLSRAGIDGELTIGEGVETCLAGIMLGYAPAWSVLDANGVATFPVLEQISRLTILVDHDMSGTGQQAAAACRARWLAAGKPVRRVTPATPGQDINDLLLEPTRQRDNHPQHGGCDE
jgi:putative DNA primase/helicase